MKLLIGITASLLVAIWWVHLWPVVVFAIFGAAILGGGIIFLAVERGGL